MEAWEVNLLGAVRELAHGPLTYRAGSTDRDGRLLQENIDALRQLGIPCMALPAEHGGRAISIEGSTRIMEAIAYADASTAVAINMHMLVADAIAFMPPFERRDAVLRDVTQHGSLICQPGSVPLAELDTRPAGFRFVEDGDHLIANGRSGFATASDAASYVLVGGTIDHGPDAEPDVAYAILSIDTPGVRVHGNWDAMGLRGTASHDVSLTDAAVPRSEVLVMPLSAMRAAARARDEEWDGTAQRRARGVLGVMGIWLGLAQAALDFTVDYAAKRYGQLALPDRAGSGTRADQSWAQIDIGHMDHWIETGRVLLYDLIERASSPYPSAQDFARDMTRVSYHLRRMGEEVAQLSMRVCGAHAYVKDRALERIFRDLVGCNVMALKTEQLALSLGQAALGMPISYTGPGG